MLKFIYVILMNLFRAPYMIPKMHKEADHPEKYSDMMYPNHQGKYDALGIIYTHKKPCSIVMDRAKSNTILVREFIDLLQGKRLDKKDVRQALTIINEVSEDVKKGKRYILFPEF